MSWKLYTEFYHEILDSNIQEFVVWLKKSRYAGNSKILFNFLVSRIYTNYQIKS